MTVSFEVQLRNFANKVKGRRDQVVRKVVLEMGTSLVMRSPVGDGAFWISPPPKGYVGGEFRANWQLGVGAIDFTVNKPADQDGSATVGSLFSKIADEPGDQVFYLTNSKVYGPRLEDGWSHRQAPQGMVAITVLQFRNFLSSAVAEAKT